MSLTLLANLKTIYRTLSVIADAPLQDSFDDVVAVYNQSIVIIECDVCANPEPAYDNYTWTANAALIPDEVEW